MNNWGKYKIIAIVAILMFFGSSTVFAAKVKKKDGQIVEGNLNGIIVLKQKGITTYSVVKGEHIESIDENGIHLRPGSKFLRLVMPNDKDDAGDIGFANSFFSGLTSLCSRPDFIGNIGGTSGECLDGEELRATDNLLGVLKYQKDKYVMAPSIEIVTVTGAIVVPINEIVAFKEAVRNPVYAIMTDSNMNIGGSWILTIESFKGRFAAQPFLVFKQEGNRVSGWLKMSDYEAPFKTFSINGNKIDFAWTSYSSDGQAVVNSYSGIFADNLIKGELNRPGEKYMWVATRKQ